MSDQRQSYYEFDDFLLDVRQRLLFLDGKPLDLTPKVFDVLLELVQNSGRVIEKKELMESVWPDSFVEEANLTQHISTLRKRLTQASDKQRYIMTVPGRGYRFLASVKAWDDEESLVTVHERIRARVIIEDEGSADAVTTGDEGDVSIASTAPSIEVIHDPNGESPLQTPLERSPQGPKVRPIIVLGLGLLFIATIASALFWYFALRDLPAFSAVKLTKFTTSGKIVCAAISPDGKYVAYVANSDAGRESLWIRQVATSNSGVQIIAPSTFHYYRLTFSPRGEYLYYLGSDGKVAGILNRVPMLGGASVQLMTDMDSPPALSPDGQQMAYIRGYPDSEETTLMIANADGSAEHRLATLKGPRESFVFPAGPTWSPDGKTIACAAAMTDEKGSYQELVEVGVKDGGLRPITHERWLKVGRAAWLQSGRGLILLAADQDAALSQVWHVSYPSGEIRRITNDLNDYKDLSVTADSRVIAVLQSDQQANIWLTLEAVRESARQITSSNYDGIDGLAWMKDGRLIYTTLTNGAQTLWTIDAGKGAQAQLSEGMSNSRSPAVSPDGRYIVYASRSASGQHLWKADADGSHRLQLTRGVQDGSPVFSPDSEWIIYRSYIHSIPNLFKVAIGGGEPVRLTDKISGPPTVSPDGKWIACAYREEALSKTRLAVIPFDSGAPPRLLEPQDMPTRLLYRWMQDGQALAYVKTEAGISNIWLQPIDGSSPQQLTDFKSGLIFNFAFSNDGHGIAMARGQIANDLVLINAVK